MGVAYRNDRRRLDQLREELAEILPRLIDDDTEKIVLFGSAVHGNVGSKSDLDLLVVRRDSRRPLERIEDLYRLARPQIALDLLVYTPAELDEKLPTSSFLRHALRNGKVVYERSRQVA